MKQEVQVVLTFEVDATKSKKDIEDFFHDMDQTYTRSVSARNRWEFPKLTLVEVKEEAEIYEVESPSTKESIENQRLHDLLSSWKHLVFGLNKENPQVLAVEVCIRDLQQVLGTSSRNVAPLEVIKDAARYIRNGQVVTKDLYTHYKKGGKYYIEDDNAFFKLDGEWKPCVTYRSTDKAIKKLFVREREEFYLKLSKI